MTASRPRTHIDDGVTEQAPLPEEHPAIAPFSFLLGRWVGTGKGDYPTIEAFDFLQEVDVLSHRQAVPDLHQPLLAACHGRGRRAGAGRQRRPAPARAAGGRGRLLAPAARGQGRGAAQPPHRDHRDLLGRVHAGSTAIEMVTDAVARTADGQAVHRGQAALRPGPEQGRDEGREGSRLRLRHGGHGLAADPAPVGGPAVGLDRVDQRKLKTPGRLRA